MHLQCPCESVPTNALSCLLVTRPPGPTLAPLQTALPKGAGWTRVLAVASYEARGTLTRPLHRVAERRVLTLALVAAAGAPVFVIAGWGVKGKRLKIKNVVYPEDFFFSHTVLLHLHNYTHLHHSFSNCSSNMVQLQKHWVQLESKTTLHMIIATCIKIILLQFSSGCALTETYDVTKHKQKLIWLNSEKRNRQGGGGGGGTVSSVAPFSSGVLCYQQINSKWQGDLHGAHGTLEFEMVNFTEACRSALVEWGGGGVHWRFTQGLDFKFMTSRSQSAQRTPIGSRGGIPHQ